MSSTATPPDGLADAIAGLTPSPSPSAIPASALTAVSDAVQAFVDAKVTLDRAQAKEKVAQARYDEIRKRTLPELFAAAGLVSPDGKASVTHASGAKVYLRTDVYAHARSEDQPALFAWLRANGAGSLIRETVHAGTLRSYVKELMEDGQALPPGVTAHPETVAVVTLPKEMKELPHAKES